MTIYLDHTAESHESIIFEVLYVYMVDKWNLINTLLRFENSKNLFFILKEVFWRYINGYFHFFKTKIWYCYTKSMNLNVNMVLFDIRIGGNKISYIETEPQLVNVKQCFIFFTSADDIRFVHDSNRIASKVSITCDFKKVIHF